MKSQTEEAVRKVKDVMGQDDVEAIRRETDALGQIVQKMGASFYQQPGAAGPGGPEGPAGGETPPGGPSGPEDVVDGEFKTT